MLAFGFGSTVVMWWIGYATHLPSPPVPSLAVGLLLLAAMVAGGWLAGRLTEGGWRIGWRAGLLAAALNMLVMGSLLSGQSPNQIRPAALVWLPGYLVLASAVGAASAWIGARGRATAARGADWHWVFACVAAAATLGLLAVGGLVTSKGAGLAVVDWPNSFGYNMFLYPLSRMTGGIYFEHAHRLFGSLVGLTTLVLAIVLLRHERRRGVRAFALLALALVVLQGVLGGLRVTGRFTLSDSPADVAPNLALAVVHGITGQLFFAAMVALAVVTAPRWKGAAAPAVDARAATERLLGAGLVLLVVVQLVLGAVLRHYGAGLVVHITFAVLVVLAGTMAGVRAWGLHGGAVPLHRAGLAVLAAVGLQLVLGVATLSAMAMRTGATRSGAEVVIATAHQVNGAVVLGAAVALALWTRRLLAVPAKLPVGGSAIPA